MHLPSTTALLLSALALSSTSALSIHIPGAKRAGAHARAAVDRFRAADAQVREAFAAAPERHAERGSSSLASGQKTKRLVRKKRAACQVPVTANATLAPSSTQPAVSATDSATSSTIINNNNLGNAASPAPSPSASPSSTATAAASSSSSSAAAAASPSPAANPSGWFHVDTWAGNSFFDNWWFWNHEDPTHGTVEYVSAPDAWNGGLISVNGQGHAIMKVDTTPQVQGGRKSVRIHGNRVFNGGLVLMDAVHMPTGCGTWPAWWSLGPNWPYGGEIDILEGVNAFEQNQVSLHTGSGCHMPQNQNDLQLGTLTTGGYDSYNCAAYETGNQGCGVRDLSNKNSIGSSFNAIGGGVYAMLWGKAGITVWFFPRNAIPADISADQPNPKGWGKPVADFPSANCDPYQFFHDHYNVFDTTLCGDWAGADSVWKYAGYAGQDQSCASITGYATCQDYVLNQGGAFANAYWEVSYVKYFNSTSEV